MYMLAGGTDASNVDPYAERPSRGGPWVQTGPHLMVVGSPSLLARADEALCRIKSEGGGIAAYAPAPDRERPESRRLSA
jgi:hypothetical protein